MTILEKLKKILSALPFFLIFFAVLGWLLYIYNYNAKMEKLEDQFMEECRDIFPALLEEEARVTVEKRYDCLDKKFKE